MSNLFIAFVSVVVGSTLGYVLADESRSTVRRSDTLLQLGYKNVVFLESPIGGDCSYFRAISPTGCVAQGAVCDDGGVR